MTRRVSVIIATYGRPLLLREALASIRALEGPDLTFEILVGDNGTMPETPETVAEFGGIYTKTTKKGCAPARNLAMQRASGEFIAFLDDDDLWLPEHIRPHIAFLDAHPDYEAVFGQIVSTNALRQPLSGPWPENLPDDGDVFSTMLGGYFPQVGGSVFRGNAVAKYGLMDETLIGDSDWDWQLRVARNGRVGFISTPCVLFLQREPGSFDDLQFKRLRYTRRIFFRHARTLRGLTFRRLYALHTAALWQFYEYFSTHAISRSQAGQQAGALRAILGAFRTLPIFTVKQLFSATPLRSAFVASVLRRPGLKLPTPQQ